jgi:hypothetical protein
MPFGAAAFAGMAYGYLTKGSRCLNAYGIVLNQFAGTFQNIFDGAHLSCCRKVFLRRPRIFSCALAKKGFTGVKDPLFSKYGYFALYCKSYLLDMLTKDLGKRYYMGQYMQAIPLLPFRTMQQLNAFSILSGHMP